MSHVLLCHFPHIQIIFEKTFDFTSRLSRRINLSALLRD